MSSLVRRLDIMCPARLNTRSEGALLPITTNTDLATLARAGKVLVCSFQKSRGHRYFLARVNPCQSVKLACCGHIVRVIIIEHI